MAIKDIESFNLSSQAIDSNGIIMAHRALRHTGVTLPTNQPPFFSLNRAGMGH